MKKSCANCPAYGGNDYCILGYELDMIEDGEKLHKDRKGRDVFCRPKSKCSAPKNKSEFLYELNIKLKNVNY